MKSLIVVAVSMLIMSGCASTPANPNSMGSRDFYMHSKQYHQAIVPGLFDQAISSARTGISGRSAQEVQKAISNIFR